MRNKKTFVGLFVILALLCLGIGYAAISQQLSVTGKITTGNEDDLAENFEVYFSDKSVASKTSDIKDATIEIAADKLSANFLVSGMSQENSEVVFTLTVKNDSGDFFATSKGYEIYFKDNYDPATSTFTDDDKIPNLAGQSLKNFVSVYSGTSDAVTYNTGDALYGRKNTFEITIFQAGAVYNQIKPGESSVITIKIKMNALPTQQSTYGFKITFNFDAEAYGATS